MSTPVRIHACVLVAALTACNDRRFPRELTHFTPYPGNPVFTPGGPGTWDEYLQERGWILREDGIYKMWYTGHTGNTDGCIDDVNCKLGYATSSDAITWQRSSSH